ncbi:Tektin-3 [Schistosoma japonicum]|uniref:Tektin n=1 Tax=Schistosoma japonicum TaxID=6182 RepID=A0A4Z2DE92_SCHJA|nr:Tektin-3 [Schistosoma japonicum]
MTERYFQKPLRLSHSASNIPDILGSSGVSGYMTKFDDPKEVSYPAIYTQRNVKSFAPWRPKSHFSPDRISYFNGVKSAKPLGPVVNVIGDTGGLHELEGLKIPSIYSAARNALYTRYTPADWNKGNFTQLTNSEQAMKRAECIRESGQRLGIEADDRVRRAQQEVSKLLGQRINDINYMKHELSNEIDALVNEMNKLNESKRIAEKSFAEIENPLHITQECLYHREKRQSTDLVHDQPEIALLKEIDGIKSCQDQIKNIINRATAQLSICRSVQHELEQDSSDKFRALQLDQLAHQLRNSSANIALYGDIEKFEKWMSVPEKWAEHTSANLKRSQAERATSRSIREAIEHCLGTTFSRIRDLWSSTNACLSQRIQETMEAKNRIQIQLEKVNQELFDVEKNIEYLKRCIVDKQAPLKVARTRLDLRNRRPNIELCHDDPHGRLLREIAELQESVDQLVSQLTDTQRIHQDLLNIKSRLEVDLSIKANSLYIDREKCLGSRKTFPMNPALIAPT